MAEKRQTKEITETFVSLANETEKGLELVSQDIYESYAKDVRTTETAKKLQNYIDEARKFKESNPKAKVIEHYSKDGKEISLNDLLRTNDLITILSLLGLEVKSCHELRKYVKVKGGIIATEIREYFVELF